MSSAPADPAADLRRLFGTVWIGTFFFNVFVLMPVRLVVVLVAPGAAPLDGVPWLTDVAAGDRLAALFMLPILASLGCAIVGLQNAVVVCLGLLANRWLARVAARVLGRETATEAVTS